MKILKIVIKREYFDEIAAKTKKIEYREMSHFWQSRLYDATGKKKPTIYLSLLMGTIKMPVVWKLNTKALK